MMKTVAIAAALLAGATFATSVQAEEPDATTTGTVAGATTGALVGGPVGAVVGGAMGMGAVQLESAANWDQEVGGQRSLREQPRSLCH